MKTKMTLMATIPALMLAVAVYAEDPSAAPKDEADAKGAIEVSAITKTAKVTAVDPAKRTVTLVNPDGITNSYELGQKVRNFDQIKVGDEVKATLLEAVAVAVSKSNAPPDVSERDLVAVAPKGAMPGVIMAKTRQISAKIVSVDPQARTVTVEGPAGGTPTFRVGANVNMNELQKGDDVTLRVTDALALRVEKP